MYRFAEQRQRSACSCTRRRPPPPDQESCPGWSGQEATGSSKRESTQHCLTPNRWRNGKKALEGSSSVAGKLTYGLDDLTCLRQSQLTCKARPKRHRPRIPRPPRRSGRCTLPHVRRHLPGRTSSELVHMNALAIFFITRRSQPGSLMLMAI
jgi:hypothetical protein